MPTNLLPLLKLKIFKSIKLFVGTPIAAIGLPVTVCYFKCTLVPEPLCEAKETRGENGELLVTSIANPTSTLQEVQNLNLVCDWPFVKIC